MTISPRFHIQHWSSGKFIHPKGGGIRGGENNWLVTYDGTGSHTEFYFEFRDGPWGYLVWAQDPSYCAHPEGGAVDAGNGAGILLHRDRHPGAYFRLDEEHGTIVHISGRYWHPHGGQSHPGNNTGIQLWDGWRDATKYYPRTASGGPVAIALPAEASLDWELVFDEPNPQTNRTHTFTRTWGLKVAHSSKRATEVTTKVEVSGKFTASKIFGMESKASVAVKHAFEQTDDQTFERQGSRTDTYEIKKGEPVAHWQRVLRATFPDGAVWEYLSGNVFADTRDRHTKPTEPQDNWRWCSACGVLHYGGHTGRCAATGAAHLTNGSPNFQLRHSQPAWAGQAGWYWCRKCGTLHYGRGARTCPAGGTHEIIGSGNYSLSVAEAGRAPDWLYCRKCGALHSAEGASVCAAGAAHDAAGSSNYTVEHA